jgi:hypothetical protein
MSSSPRCWRPRPTAATATAARPASRPPASRARKTLLEFDFACQMGGGPGLPQAMPLGCRHLPLMIEPLECAWRQPLTVGSTHV